MARINNLVNFLTDIANAIRNKTGKSTTIQPEDMDTEIGSIQTQPNLQSKSVEITENTTTNITADTGYDGLSSVAVTTNVSGGNKLTLPNFIRFRDSGCNNFDWITNSVDTSNITDTSAMRETIRKRWGRSSGMKWVIRIMLSVQTISLQTVICHQKTAKELITDSFPEISLPIRQRSRERIIWIFPKSVKILNYTGIYTSPSIQAVWEKDTAF